MFYNSIIQINPFILLAFSALFAWVNSVSANGFSKWVAPNGKELYLGLVIKQVTAIALISVTIGIQKFSLTTFLLALLFGTCIAVNVSLSQIALCNGPMTVYVMVSSSGTMLNAISGAVFWNEKLSLQKIGGIAGILVMMFLIIGAKGDAKKPNLKFLIATFIATVASVAVGFCQKIHQNTAYKDEFGSFLIISFAVSSILMLVFMLKKTADGEKITKDFSLKSKALWLPVLGGVAFSIVHILNLYLSGAIESAVFFPCANGLPMILSVIAAVVLFRERPTLKQTVGVIIGIISVFLLGVEL